MSPGLIFLTVSLLLGIQTLTTDLYQPMLPAMTTDFGALTLQAQLTLSMLLLAFGCSQLVWGLPSDRFDSRPNLLWGLPVYTLASIGGTLVPPMALLLVWRAVQKLRWAQR